MWVNVRGEGALTALPGGFGVRWRSETSGLGQGLLPQHLQFGALGRIEQLLNLLARAGDSLPRGIDGLFALLGIPRAVAMAARPRDRCAARFPIVALGSR